MRTKLKYDIKRLDTLEDALHYNTALNTLNDILRRNGYSIIFNRGHNRTIAIRELPGVFINVNSTYYFIYSNNDSELKDYKDVLQLFNFNTPYEELERNIKIRLMEYSLGGGTE